MTCMSETHAPSGLLPWLKATIEGDKAAAEAARGLRWDDDWEKQQPGPGAWQAVDDAGRHQLWEADRWEWVATDRGTEPEEYTELDPAHVTHMAIHDPRDTIARCEAELALLDEHRQIVDGGRDRAWPAPGHCLECRTPDGEDYQPFPCRTVRLLASGYRHRPGFKPDWTDLP